MYNSFRFNRMEERLHLTEAHRALCWQHWRGVETKPRGPTPNGERRDQLITALPWEEA